MGIGAIIGIIILVLVVAVIGAFISIYNGLVTVKQKVKNAWSQIEVQLQKRFDLVPNLVETVKGYAKHEKEVLDKVTELRSSWASAKSNSEKVEVENQFAGALKTIMAVAENYPELKANANFMELQTQLQEIEEKIAFSRAFYNDAVTMYNTKIRVFPNNIVAGMIGYTDEALFTVDNEEAKKNVKVEF